jgi:cysteine rich repeat protein
MLHRLMLAAVILVSIPCWNAMAETEAERKACANDAQTHCPDEVPDRERVAACLMRKVDLLSPPCKKIIRDALEAQRRRH